MDVRCFYIKITVFILILGSFGLSVMNFGIVLGEQTETNEVQQWRILHIVEVLVHEDTSKGSSEIYVKVFVNNKERSVTPTVRNVDDSDQVIYNWNITIGLLEETNSINVSFYEERPSYYLSDFEIGVISFTGNEELKKIKSSQTPGGEITLTWQFFVKESNNKPEDDTPAPYVVENKSFDWIPILSLGLLMIGTAVAVGGFVVKLREKRL